MRGFYLPVSKNTSHSETTNYKNAAYHKTTPKRGSYLGRPSRCARTLKHFSVFSTCRLKGIRVPRTSRSPYAICGGIRIADRWIETLMPRSLHSCHCRRCCYFRRNSRLGFVRPGRPPFPVPLHGPRRSRQSFQARFRSRCPRPVHALTLFRFRLCPSFVGSNPCFRTPHLEMHD